MRVENRSPSKKGKAVRASRTLPAARDGEVVTSSAAASAPWPSRLRVFWLLSGVCCTLPFCFNVMRNSDLWWHLAAGRLIVSGRAIPTVDSWSFTAAGHRWLNHEWLAQVVFYLCQRWLGLEGLTLWFFGILLLTALLLQDALQQWTGRPFVSLLCSTWAMALASPFFEFRPHLYTLLGLSLLLRWSLLRGAPDRWWLAAIFVPWANLHGGVLLGLMVVGIWGFVWVVVRAGSDITRSIRLYRAAAVFGACLLASFCNPNGVDAVLYPIRIAPGANGAFVQILEWFPPFANGGLCPALYPWAIAGLGVALLWLILSQQINVHDMRFWTVLGVAGLTLAMSIASARFIPLFAIAQAPVLAVALHAALLRASRIGLVRPLRSPSLKQVMPPVLAASVGLAILQRYPLRADVFRELTSEESFPVEVLNFVEQTHLSGNVFAYEGWGGYIQWRTNGLRTYYDGRTNTVFDQETYEGYLRVQFLLPGWMDTLETSSADYFLWPRFPWNQLPDVGQARALVASGRWRIIYSDFAAVLLARRNLFPPVTAADTPDSPYKRLALGIDAMQRGQADAAQRQLEGALEMDPFLLPACRNLAIVLAHVGRVAEALAMAKHCQAIFPDPATDEAVREELGSKHPQGGPTR